MSNSRNVPGSNSRFRRSRAVSLPFSLCWATALSPPILSSLASRAFKSLIFSSVIPISPIPFRHGVANSPVSVPVEAPSARRRTQRAPLVFGARPRRSQGSLRSHLKLLHFHPRMRKRSLPTYPGGAFRMLDETKRVDEFYSYDLLSRKKSSLSAAEVGARLPLSTSRRMRGSCFLIS